LSLLLLELVSRWSALLMPRVPPKMLLMASIDGAKLSGLF
jgi:hypothetical protein